MTDETNPRISSLVTGAAYGALAVAGLLLAVIEGFTYHWSVLVAVLFCVLNLAGFWAAGWGMGGKFGAAVPFLPWLAVTVLLAEPRAEGSVIVDGTTGGYVLLIGGLAAGVLAIVATPAANRPELPAGSRNQM